MLRISAKRNLTQFRFGGFHRVYAVLVLALPLNLSFSVYLIFPLFEKQIVLCGISAPELSVVGLASPTQPSQIIHIELVPFHR